jgi:DNA polymerase-3 subunit epsilon/CBS domain-containing protein
MSNLLQATPLFAIRGVAIDAETTGLDVKRARMIEIAAVHLDGGRLDRANAFQSLVACDVEIPARAHAVHGIDRAALVGAPGFDQLYPGIAAFIAGRIVIGHTIGFDIAMLQQEVERLGQRFIPPLALDIRLLAQLAEPGLPSYSLEALGAWLDIPAQERHRALGDAMAAGLVFLALAPRLRDRGIRTVGEAIAASRRITDAMAGAAPPAWELRAPSADGDPLPQLDSYPYRHRVREVMRADPAILPETVSVAEALAAMAGRGLSSVFIGERLSRPGAMAILTERDLLRALASAGAAALTQPAVHFATRPVVAVPAEAFLYRAIGRMSARSIRHLAVTDEEDRIVGVVTPLKLLQLRASTAVALGDDIDAAPDAPALGQIWARLPLMARALLAEDVPARMIAAVVAREVGALTRRATILAEAELVAAGAGPAPCAYAVLVLGSAGRGESLLAMDQDNAVIFAEGEPGGEADQWFARLGKRMAAILDEVGVPLCKGGVMASQPDFRGSVATWRQRIAQWLSRSNPQDLLSVDIVFDFAAVHGDRAMAEQLWRDAWAAAKGQIPFLKLLAENAGQPATGLTLFGGLRTEDDGRIDLKRTGLKDIVTTARLLALHHGVPRHTTQARLEAVAELGTGGAGDLAEIERDHALLVDCILSQQLADIAAGLSPSNRVAPGTIGKARTAALKQALGRLSILEELRRDQLSA